MSSFRARCARHREWSGDGHEGERDGPCSPVLPVARETGRVPDSTGVAPAGREGPESGRHTQGTASLWGESPGAPILGAVCGHRRGQQAALEVGQACPRGQAARGVLPHACPPSSRRPSSGGQAHLCRRKTSASQLHQQPSGFQPLWACSQHGQWEPGPGGSPGCLLELSPGQRVARARPASAERHTQPFPGELSRPLPGGLPATFRTFTRGSAARGGWTRGATGEKGGGRADPAGWQRNKAGEVSQRERHCQDSGARGAGGLGSAALLLGFGAGWVAVTSLGKRAPQGSRPGQAGPGHGTSDSGRVAL